MSIVAISAAAITAAVLALTLRPKNGEVALLLTAAASAIVLTSMLGQAASVINTVNSIVSASGISTGYVAILLKVIGICLLTEFTAEPPGGRGQHSALAANVTLAGKLMATVTALPLYAGILNTVLSIVAKVGSRKWN